ncbi:hypothetical protein SAMN04488020_11523 [Palleronia marisminoris]|uniref:Uncharacterized protein n=1 Tax=Palleronia marisminoris TaxID=315423 RepID=A0A1Y5TRG2_9RHOB|nr:hypothetical protein [Palleronia marisminoris]SFH45665.1 hypothetical protein SAMN04488020_11523 [Palleronia marisminoris]SLN68009.1 hypothetical protein PAM7066_03418 [Palleronia marisminoris]
MSPDGTRIAYIASCRDRLNDFPSDIKRKERRKLEGERRITTDAHPNFKRYFRSTNEDSILHLKNVNADWSWHVFQMAVADVEVRSGNLTHPSEKRVVGCRFPTGC